MTTEIIIEDYSKNWKNSFEKLKAVYDSVLGGLVLDVQHVGSTSVPGLAAKPVIDIDLIIEDKTQLPPVLAILETLGYQHLGDLGIKDREAFRRKSEYVPENGSHTVWAKHNLYVCPKNSLSLQNHLAVRDYLRANKGKAAQYAGLKRQLAAKYPHNIDVYVEGKTGFIAGILKECGIADSDLDSIAAQNRAAGRG